MQLPETHYARRPDGVSIGYQVVGDGPVDLLYAPGFVSHLDLQWTDPGFTRFLERLSSFARLITFDKPGTGVSDPIDHLPTLEERVEDLKIVLAAAGAERASLMGFSESGPTCLLFAATAPEQVHSLILYGSFAQAQPPAERPDDMPPEEYETALKRAAQVKAGLDDLVSHWGEGRIVDHFAPSIATRMQRRFWATYERAAASPRMAQALLDAVQKVDVSDLLPSLAVPTLLIHQVEDFMPVEASRFMARRIPGAKLLEIPGRDHAFWLGDFDPVVDEIQAFVTGSRAAPRVDRALATVMFTDIVRSTELASELGDRSWRDLLARHDAAVRAQVEAYGGRVVKSLGDGTLAVFDGPARAIACAENLREDLASLGLKLRSGVHTGECELIGDDVGGLGVHIAARVMSLSDADEILVSSTVADLVVGSDLYFHDRGKHTLKGVPGEWRLLAVGRDRRSQTRHDPLPAARETMRASDRVAVTLARRTPRMMRWASRVTRPA